MIIESVTWPSIPTVAFQLYVEGKLFLKQAPDVAYLDLTTLSMADKQTIVSKMVAFNSHVPAEIFDAYMARQEFERMVDRIEWETSMRGDNEGVGRIPALFTTLTAPWCIWRRLNKLIAKWQGVRNFPGRIH